MEEYDSYKKSRSAVFNKRVTNEILEARYKELSTKFKMRAGLLAKDIEQELAGKQRHVPQAAESSDDEDTEMMNTRSGQQVSATVHGYGSSTKLFKLDKSKMQANSDRLERFFDGEDDITLDIKEASQGFSPNDTYEFLCPDTFERFVKFCDEPSVHASPSKKPGMDQATKEQEEATKKVPLLK